MESIQMSRSTSLSPLGIRQFVNLVILGVWTSFVAEGILTEIGDSCSISSVNCVCSVNGVCVCGVWCVVYRVWYVLVEGEREMRCTSYLREKQREQTQREREREKSIRLSMIFSVRSFYGATYYYVRFNGPRGSSPTMILWISLFLYTSGTLWITSLDIITRWSLTK